MYIHQFTDFPGLLTPGQSVTSGIYHVTYCWLLSIQLSNHLLFFYTFDHEQASEETLDDLPVKFTQVS